MRTLDEVKHYYKDVTRDEMVLDIYLDMVVYQKVSDELQSYKTKEDKIREYIETQKEHQHKTLAIKDIVCNKLYKVLQILNEGSDDNE